MPGPDVASTATDGATAPSVPGGAVADQRGSALAAPAPTGPWVTLVGVTRFVPPADLEFDTDAEGGQALAEFAGRACYQSFDKPVAATASNAGYLAHILQVGHLSVLEHASATFYLRRISRGVTHELLRHRHLSVSELSPRYVPDAGLPAVVPPAVAAEGVASEDFRAATELAAQAQRRLLRTLQERAVDAPDGTLARKQARQAAQAVLPAATETAAVVTGNLRAWRHFVGMRGTDSVDVEIRSLAVRILELLRAEAPNVFADFRISSLLDGTTMAASPLVGEG
ncbi:FAD-dependent thymidylate synthase [Nakamurella endophytica]|uniref:Flavin-dependent thymidylate synthase n=1 Tax=Nakamurella endophytica TaxID=1748367 RepID=A0A917SU58_9ACTN|nr:FAD-dependent thymidylate synthase [Nakamurella endophytica]GGL95267.1 flavin-dependent thymidylate synthase [Nakamurella endophytica]